MAAIAAPPKTGAAVIIGAKALELADEAAPAAPEEALEPAAEALAPALLAAPLREDATLDKLEPAAPPPTTV
jgi:hypothetical protein